VLNRIFPGRESKKKRLGLEDLREILDKITKKRTDKNGNCSGQYLDFPKGCECCPSGTEWDCRHENANGTIYECNWRLNFWKYEEIKVLIGLYKAKQGGMDLNRIKSLHVDDFVKIAIISEYV